jgi:hypothetical protein
LPAEHSRRRRAGLAVTLALATLLGGCDRAPTADAELLVVTADSTYWLVADAGTVRLRGVPMLVTRIDGRFKELYVTDDDRSFYNAVFVGHRLFVRDLARGDSTEIHRDTVVARLAVDYGMAHPDEQPLGPDEPENDNAVIRATSDLEIIAVHGPYVSYEHHTDVDARDERTTEHRHEFRRGVVDARNARRQDLASLFGATVADTMASRASAEWLAMRDTVLSVAGDRRRARRAVESFTFDPRSFSIASVGQAPAVVFAVPARGDDPDVEPVELAPRPVAEPPWWPSVAAELPAGPGEGGSWGHGRDTLDVHLDREDRTWSLSLRLGRGAAPAALHVSSAVERVIWLNEGFGREQRAALDRAFSEAAGYDGTRQVALAPARASVHLARNDRATRPAPRLGLSSRVVGADDAAGREHPRARVRRSHPRDARQDRRGRGDAPLPNAVRHGIG